MSEIVNCMKCKRKPTKVGDFVTCTACRVTIPEVGLWNKFMTATEEPEWEAYYAELNRKVGVLIGIAFHTEDKAAIEWLKTYEGIFKDIRVEDYFNDPKLIEVHKTLIGKHHAIGTKS